jgi:hypothetical protein
VHWLHTKLVHSIAFMDQHLQHAWGACNCSITVKFGATLRFFPRLPSMRMRSSSFPVQLGGRELD